MPTKTAILVLDDEPGIRFYLEELLIRDGHRVMTASTGEQALSLIAAEEFDLALLDINLPAISGLDVLMALRQQSPDTIPIVLTAYASLDTAVEALRSGAHDYLFKPCRAVDLRESIRQGLLKREELLARRRLLAQLPAAARQRLERDGLGAPLDEARLVQPRPRFRQSEDLLVDFMRHIITFKGRLLELSPTEFDLLAYLVTEAPRVVSAQELLRETRGYQTDATEASNLIRYHIYRIRNKVQDVVPEADLIMTIRGVGYSIAERHL